MRRQRYLRTPSAQSLCIFCACRLGVGIPSAQLAPLVSATARRSISTTPIPRQSAATASASGNNNASSSSQPAFEFVFDPNSSLTRSEQQEKARRRALQQEQEIREQQRRQEQIWQEQEARLQAQAKQGPRNQQLPPKKGKPENWPKNNVPGTTLRKNTRPETASSTVEGLKTLNQSLFNRKQRTSNTQRSPSNEKRTNPNIQDAPAAPSTANRTARIHYHNTYDRGNAPIASYPTQSGQSDPGTPNPNIQDLKDANGASKQNGAETDAQARNRGGRGEQRRVARPKAPPRVAMPDFLIAPKNVQATEEPSGWGTGDADMKPLEYGSLENRPIASNSNPNIEDASNRNSDKLSSGLTKEEDGMRSAIEQSKQAWGVTHPEERSDAVRQANRSQEEMSSGQTSRQERSPIQQEPVIQEQAQEQVSQQAQQPGRLLRPMKNKNPGKHARQYQKQLRASNEAKERGEEQATPEAHQENTTAPSPRQTGSQLQSEASIQKPLPTQEQARQNAEDDLISQSSRQPNLHVEQEVPTQDQPLLQGRDPAQLQRETQRAASASQEPQIQRPTQDAPPSRPMPADFRPQSQAGVAPSRPTPASAAPQPQQDTTRPEGTAVPSWPSSDTASMSDNTQRRPQLHFSMSDAEEYKYDRDYANPESARAPGPPEGAFTRSDARVPMSNRYDARYDASVPNTPPPYWQRPQPPYAPVSQRDEYNPEYRISESRRTGPGPAAYDGKWGSFEDEQYGDAGPDPAQHRPAPPTGAGPGYTQGAPRHYGDELPHSQYSQGFEQQDQAGFDDSYDGIPLDADRRRPEPHPSEFGRYPQHVPRNARTFGFEEEHRRDPYYAEQQPPSSQIQPRKEPPPPSRFSGSFQNYENIQYDAPPTGPRNAYGQQYQRPAMGAETLGSFESDGYYESQYQYPDSRINHRAQTEGGFPPMPSQPGRQAFSAPHYHQDDQRRGAFGYDSYGHGQPPPHQPQRYQDYDRRGVSQPLDNSYGPPQQRFHSDNDDGGQASFYDRQPAPYRPGSSGYRAVPIDMRELGQSTDLPEEDHSADWQHLRRRDSEPASASPPAPAPAPAPAQYQSHPERKPAMSVQDIDRIFANYQQQRDSYRPPPPPRPVEQDSTVFNRNIFENKPVENRICARCGEKGHIARDCSQPVQPRYMGGPAPQSKRPPAPDAPFKKPEVRADRFFRPEFERPADEDRRGIPAKPAFVQSMNEDRRDVPFKPAFERPVDQLRERDPRSVIREPESVGEEAPKRSSRRDRFVIDEDDDVDLTYSRGNKRKERRANRRQEDDEDDEDQSARDEYRARKAERQSREDADRQANLKAARRERAARKAEQATPITLPEFISVQHLSQVLGVRYEQFVERLEELGYDDVFPGKTLNSETSGMIAMEYNFEPTFDTGAREEEERDLKPRPELEDKEFLPVRPPVVTIMGHVDHGKTTILDYLRKSSVAAGEAGGITQHIGAFSVPLTSSGKTVTFLDTPGHAAFLAMRQRGANVTDIVILVVAADDSVKPQTLEALKHAQAAKVPIIVALNKVDKPEADIERCKQDLARHGVEIEDYGGDTQVVCVSGKTGQGMDELEENVVTLSEILDHRAETDGPVEGWVLEATTKKAGRVATVLVRRGTLKPGAVIVAGKTWARVRSLKNEAGKALTDVGPGMPVEVDGWKDQPAAGDEVLQAPSEQKANSVIEYRLEITEREKTAQDMEAINEARRIEQEKREREKAAEQAAKRAAAAAEDGAPLAAASSSPQTTQEQETGQMVVPFIIKADVSGSAEAVSAYIQSVSSPLIAPQILQSSVGAVHESDVELANAAQGHIIAFNLPSDPDMKALAESRGVKVLENNIIYRVLDDVKAVLEEKLPPIVTQRVLGEAEISAAFEISLGGRKKQKIAGCKVRNGLVGKNSRVRVLRGGEKVYDGIITSLKNVKKDVMEMRKGSECGMGFEDWEGFEVGDQIQTYVESEERRKL